MTCAVKWASGRCSAPWRIADTVEEVLNLAKVLDVPFVHVKKTANSVADVLAKEVVSQQCLWIDQISPLCI